jgi:Putative auto-transporter adhesin, head GIN domain
MANIYKKMLILLAACGMLLSGCSSIPGGRQVIYGSGKVISQTRSVSGFTAVALEGSGNVDIAFGPAESVVVEAEDNLLPVIETVRQNNVLIIRTRPNTTIQTNGQMQVHITMKSLTGVTVEGSGNITVPQLSGDSFSAALPGSGTITVGGTAKRVDLSLGGSGNIFCDKLQAKTATVTLNGSGNITVNASESLDASINGSGDIRYSGSPAKINTKVRGSGNIHP